MKKIKNKYTKLNKKSSIELKEEKKLTNLIKQQNKSKNKKSETLNIDIKNNDLIMINHLSKKLNIKKSEILNHYLTFFTESLFNSIDPYKDQKTIAKIVDALISKNELNHKYEEKTWMMNIITSPHYPENEYNLNNEGEYSKSIFNQDKENNNA